MRTNLNHRRRVWLAMGATLLGLATFGLHGRAEESRWATGVAWPEPKVVEPGQAGGPPSDAIVLFDGKDLSAWNGTEHWTIRDGCAICGANDITTRQCFGDCQLHVEWFIPADVSGKGQGRGNSGVYLMGLYEVQVLESYRNENQTYRDGQAGAIYKQRPPLVSACRKPGEWQAYDIVFMAPRFDEKGRLLSPAYLTVFQNGVLIQNHFPLLGHTSYFEAPRYQKRPDKLPLSLQYHGQPIRFRNIWVRDLETDHDDLLTPFREKLKTDAGAH